MLPWQAIVIALLLTVALPAAAEPGEVRRGIELPLPFGRTGQYRFESGDFDGDGAADLAYTSTEGTIPVWYHAGMFDPDARRVGPEMLTNLEDHDRPGGTVGDYNGDGFDDLLVATHVAYAGYLTDFWVCPGGPEGLSEESRMLLSPIPQGQPLPWDGVVRGAHDEDGDGFDDAFLLQNYDQTRLGVYRGSSAGLPADPSLVLEADHGFRATVLDVDGDGFDDVVGAFNSNSHDIDTSTFFVWNGPLADGQAPTQLPPYTPESYTDWVNLDPFTSGDVDGDGYDDLVTSYSLAVWPGSDAGLETSPSATVRPWGGWSFNASTAVDVDGDGFVDVVTGVMPGWNNADGSIGPHPDEGNLFVFWGGPDFIREDRYVALPDGGVYDIDSIALRTQAGITGFARGSWDWEGEYLEVYQVPPPPPSSPGIVIEHDCGCTSGGGSGAAGWAAVVLAACGLRRPGRR